MAKQGMKRPEPEHRKNDLPPVPQASNDLALDNLMNDLDLTAADIQDFRRKS